MKRVIKYQTSDGILHSTRREAEHHAEERLGNKLTSLAARLAQIDKYSPICEFIRSHLHEFSELNALAADRDFEGEDEEE